jgi:hypothetical protein
MDNRGVVSASKIRADYFEGIICVFFCKIHG